MALEFSLFPDFSLKNTVKSPVFLGVK